MHEDESETEIEGCCGTEETETESEDTVEERTGEELEEDDIVTSPTGVGASALIVQPDERPETPFCVICPITIEVAENATKHSWGDDTRRSVRLFCWHAVRLVETTSSFLFYWLCPI